MAAAMGYCFSVTKLDKPVSNFDGSIWVSRATAFAQAARISAPRIRSLLIGIIAVNDIDYVLRNDTIYLDVHGRGEAIDRHAWRRLLSAAHPVREPMTIRPKVDDRSIGPVRVQSAW
jgi:hypothetical protein